MATFLYRVGHFSHDRRRSVLVAWILLLVVLGGLAAAFSKPASTQLTIPGVESVNAQTVLQERFPGAGGATARVVFAAPAGAKVSDAASKAAITATLAEVAKAGDVVSVSDPFATQTVSPDGRVAYSTVGYGVEAAAVTPEDQEQLLATSGPAEKAGLQVEYGGEATQAVPATSATEAIGVVVALVVLAVTFGSMLAAGLPLLTALIGVGIGITAVQALSYFVQFSSVAPVLGLMIGLAVGIDYALFIAIRYKEHLGLGMAPREAAARAVATAGSAVVFAGATVMIALAGLSVVGIPFLTAMGLVAAGMVAVAVLVALTLVPALLGFAGERFSRWPVPGLRKRQERLKTRVSFGTRWAGLVTRHPVVFLLAAVIGTGVMALPLASLQLGLPDDGSQPTTSTQRKAYDLLAQGFGEGFNGPLIVVVDAPTGTSAQAAATAVGRKIATLPDVTAVAPAVLNQAGDTAIVTVIPSSGPSTEATTDLVASIREARGTIQTSTGTDILVTGNTAVGVDISHKLKDALPIFLIVVVGLSLIVLTIAFRSILVPIKATLGFLLSLGATFGALVAVFQWGWLASLFGVSNPGAIISFLPVLLVGLLFGLAMDYEVFLVSRMREDHLQGADPKEAVIGGFRHGARVVTAAALIMTSVFAGFILGSDSTIKSIGFALAFGVLVDAFVIRMTLVPAVMTLLGTRAWWLPRWLDRLVPNVDVEGAGLAAESDEDPERTRPEHGVHAR